MGPVRAYACGITPYELTHLGHAATFVWVDTALRVLRSLGIRTELCRNVTDVDDALTSTAARSQTPYEEIAVVQQFDFERQMNALGVARPTHEPRAHNYINHVIALANGLVAADHAYVSDGSVYFRGERVLARCGLTEDDALDAMRAQGDDPDDPAKHNPIDTPLWRSSAGSSGPGWPSPWGEGRPGWHAECTAMALATFGPAIDLHLGGADLRFPHHAFESCQAEALTGVRPFARSWLHVGEVQVDGAKMAKSAGNFVLVSDLLRDHTPGAIRLALVNRPFGESWDYSAAAMVEAADLLANLTDAAHAHGNESGPDAVREALRVELDVPGAVQLALEAKGQAAELLLQVLGVDSL